MKSLISFPSRERWFLPKEEFALCWLVTRIKVLPSCYQIFKPNTMSSSLFGALNCCLLSPHGCPFAVGSEFFNLLMFHLHVFYPYLEDSFGLTINQFIVHPHVPGRLSLIRQVNSFKGGLDPNLSPADDSAGGPGEGARGGGQGRAKGGPGSCQGASFSSFTTS